MEDERRRAGIEREVLPEAYTDKGFAAAANSAHCKAPVCGLFSKRSVWGSLEWLVKI